METERNAPPEVLEAVQQEYEATLEIPSEKPPRQWMLMPVGYIGAGKTTVVKPMAQRLNLIRLSTDDVRRMLKERGYSYEGCREIIRALSRKYLAQGYSVAFDANTGSRTGMEYNAKTAKEFPDVPQLFVHVNPPEAFIIEKLKKYKHTWLFKDGDHAVANYYTYKKDNPVPADLDFVYEFDTSRDDLDAQIGEAISAIQKRLGMEQNG